ncbi:MAG: acyl-CoA/acyl-ACP dehydrogenase [Myxococcales bacterium]|nr:acyl-CoA/acyl-ACP dehydrogenase [Myxococcales bacterium]
MTKWAAPISQIVTPLEAVVAAALSQARVLGINERTLDAHQPLVVALAYAATELEVVRHLVTAHGALSGAARMAEGDRRDLAQGYRVAIARVARRSRDRLHAVAYELGDEAKLGTALAAVTAPAFGQALQQLASHAELTSFGERIIARRGQVPAHDDETTGDVRASVRQFANKTVAPIAAQLHLQDLLVPDALLSAMAELGYFGLSVPERFGGNEMGHLAMIVTTEELSRGSLAGGGSLITRPEILAKALVHGGSAAQQATWLPLIASGKKMVAISVTEPDIGSDVASLRCRAEATTVEGVAGYSISGAKAWCTFAGRADIIALLARTDADASKGAKGLSLFIVEKPPFAGHAFELAQPGGGTLHGQADHTPGYRGMHSFSLAFDKWFVPATHLVGEAAGVGRGFYLQMAGFAAGRLQTGGRACGLMQAALEATCGYVADRAQFGQPLATFGLTQASIAEMASSLIAARAITYVAAQAMDVDERAASILAAGAKLFACDAAVECTQMGQVLHGGWGYAEEYAISRHVADALVLPIFEGVRPVLILKVIARGLFSAA